MPQTTTDSVSLSQKFSTTMASFFAQVYGWMTVGLLTTAFVTFFVNTNIAFQYWLATNSWSFTVIFLVELVLVIILSAAAPKLNPLLAGALFLVYSMLTGLVFGIIVIAYTEGTVFLAFAITAGVFLLMSAFGFLTKMDLTKWGTLALIGIVGIILGTLINLFLQSDGVNWLLTYLAIGFFLILVAYDTQKLKKIAMQAESGGSVAGLAVLGALSLYLDFVNLFLRILQIFGKRK